MTENMENQSTTVRKASPVEENRSGWEWVEPSIWTDRMLTALETGVRGGKWHSLIDKVYSPKNLHAAWKKVKRNKGSAGVDHQTIGMYGQRLNRNLERLHTQIKTEQYHPQAIRRTWIPKPGKRNEKRPLGIPTVRDRIAQTALRNAIEPIFEVTFSDNSYGFRPNRGCKDALREVNHYLKTGYTWVVDVDLESYFDTINHGILMKQIQNRISDTRLLKLIHSYLEQKIMDTTKGWTPEKGSPQGAVISPLLSNIYLDPLDKLMEQSGFKMIRYADDMVILCRTQIEAETAYQILKNWTDTAKLILHPEKTRIVDSSQPGGFDFLGYHFERNFKWPSKKSMNKLKDKIRYHTRRTNGHSMEYIIIQLNKTLKGWFEYFKHSHRTTWRRIDQWIRMRLRSILRKRNGGRGRGHGRDHNKWPNAYFADHGLLFLYEAWETACQSV
jgi:RNA-directed DNA polymerase